MLSYVWVLLPRRSNMQLSYLICKLVNWSRWKNKRKTSTQKFAYWTNEIRMGTHISVKTHCLQTFHVSFVYMYLLTASSIPSSLSFSFSSSLQCLLAFFIEKILYVLHYLIQKFASVSKTKNIYLSCLKHIQLLLILYLITQFFMLSNLSKKHTCSAWTLDVSLPGSISLCWNFKKIIIVMWRNSNYCNCSFFFMPKQNCDYIQHICFI